MKRVFYLILLCVFVGTQAQDQPVLNADNEKVSSVKPKKVEFTLRNNSLKSIPLWIPGVMNPNLSPVSNSGVGLRVGQKVYFKYRGKKTVLLEVDASNDGQIIEVSQLIKDLSGELDSKRSRKGQKEKSGIKQKG